MATHTIYLGKKLVVRVCLPLAKLKCPEDAKVLVISWANLMSDCLKPGMTNTITTVSISEFIFFFHYEDEINESYKLGKGGRVCVQGAN